MNKAYLILGSNKGNKQDHLQSALKSIEEKAGKISVKSSVFSTKAWGNTNQPDFYNQAILIETELSPQDLLKQLLFIEKEEGRIRTKEKWQERTLDIDILFYNNDIITTPELTIPHPHIQNRMFVLVPMVQIAMRFVHPLLDKSMMLLMAECEDKLEVKIVK